MSPLPMHHPAHRGRPGGFSLVELLVVIGIIVVLLGILIPVVSRVRQAGWSANTQNTLANIANAIERYHMDHRAYPGLVNDNAIPGAAFQEYNGPNTGPITTTENLVLSLVGGIRFEGTQQVYDPEEIGRGPRNMSNNQRINAYIDEQSSGLAPRPWDLALASDTVIPEFMDRFPEPMPIIYVRAAVGAPGVIRLQDSDPSRQYSLAHLTQYFQFPGETDQQRAEAAVEYFAHPTLNSSGTLTEIAANGTPRAKDAFMLISPGRDRRYGTDDDITYPPR